ncbi:hypothetical protein HOD02_00580 [bacterium]|jgi:hypothetical protein|nr:hypothetical protein [bacterium]
MKSLVIDEDLLYRYDEALHGKDFSQYQSEINNIVNVLWNGIGEYEELLAPFFTRYLEVRAVPSLYISYFSLSQINKDYDNVTIEASSIITDIVGKYFKFNFSNDCEYFDADLGLLVADIFASPGSKLKIFIRNIKYNLSSRIAILRGVEVLYLNAGKLHEDFSRISNSYNGLWLTQKKSDRINWDIDQIKNTIRDNIKSLNLSIPNKLLIELIEKRVLNNLEFYLNTISVFVDFIEQNNVRLVISSAVNNEGFLSLLAAAKLTSIDSLVIPHGVVYSFNPKLNNYVTYQGTLNDFEPKYSGAKQIKFRMKWFEKKI